MTRGSIADSLSLYIGGFSTAAKDVIDKFDFGVQIERLSQGEPALPGPRAIGFRFECWML